MKPLRFFLVGGGAALLFFACMALFHGFGVPPLIGNGAAYLLAFAVAYPTQRSWTFAGKAEHRRAFPRYFVLQLACACLSGLLGHALAFAGLPPLVAAGLVTLAASATSYVLSSRWVFQPSRAN
jgi:putative flippase GtrA